MAFTVTPAYTWSAGNIVTASRLNSTGSPTVPDNQSYVFAVGSVGSPSVSFNGDTNTGMYWPSADTVALVAGGQEGLRVIGNKLVTGSTATNAVQFGTTAASTGAPVTSGTDQTNGAFRSRGGNGVFDIGHRANGNAWVQVADATALGTEYHLELMPNGGRVLVGGTSDDGTSLLQLNGATPSLALNESGVRVWTWQAGGVSSGSLSLVNGSTSLQVLTADGSSNVIVGDAAVATTATDKFLYIPSCPGTPTGTPTSYTGRVPLVVDSTNNKLYFYSGGAWRDAGP